MKIAIGCDHGGYRLKETVIEHLRRKGHEVKDLGTYSEDAVDYPDYAVTVSEEVLAGRADCGILICGTGIGMSIAANKIKGIRCAHVTDTFSGEMAKVHNNANLIALGERITGPGLALKIVDAYLDAEFGGSRHEVRVKKIMSLEE